MNSTANETTFHSYVGRLKSYTRGGCRIETPNKERKYHGNKEDDDVIYITAGKTRIIEIYTDLKNGYKLDRRGNRI